MVLTLPVFSGMAVPGGITASNPAAGEASPEMDPRIAHLDTGFAHVAYRLDRHQVDEVLARGIHFR